MYRSTLTMFDCPGYKVSHEILHGLNETRILITGQHRIIVDMFMDSISNEIKYSNPLAQIQDSATAMLKYQYLHGLSKR